MRRPNGIPRRHRSPEEIGELLEDYERSGLTQQAFADTKGVSLSSLSVWLRKARDSGLGKGEILPSTSRLVPVTIRSAVSSSFELVTSGGATLRIPPDFDPDALERLLALLEARC